jgi:membrane protein
VSGAAVNLQERWYDLIDRGRQPRLVRAGLRYVVAWGGLTAGGVTVAALLSLTAALTIIVNVARAFLGSRPVLFGSVIDTINEVLPGVIDDGANDGLLDQELLLRDTGWGWTTAVSALLILWFALTMMTGLRRAVRQMFGLGGAPLRFARGKAIDVLAFAALGSTLIASSLLVSGVTLLGQSVLDWLGWSGWVPAVLLAAGVIALVAVLDALAVLLVLRVAAKVRVPWPDLRQGMLLGALGFGLLRLGGTSVLAAWADNNPLFVSAAAVATLLVGINLAVRWLLFCAAWTANPPAAHVPVHPDTVHAGETPNYVTLSALHTLDWPHHQVTGALIPSPDPRFHREPPRGS